MINKSCSVPIVSGKTGIIDNSKLVSYLWNEIRQHSNGFKEVLKKEVSDFGPVNLVFSHLLPEVGNGKISRINNADFASKALGQINNYRFIGNDLYSFVDSSFPLSRGNLFGTYVLASGGEPFFTLSVKKSDWIYNPIKIFNFEEKGYLEHIPNSTKCCVKPLSEINLKLSVKDKGNMLEGVYQNILEFYGSQK